MKKHITLTLILACTLVCFSQETIQQPTAINTWTYVNGGGETPWNKNISFQYDQRGNLTHYHHTINYPGSPYETDWQYTYNQFGLRTYAFESFVGGSSFYSKKYFYSYDDRHNLKECTVKYRDKEVVMVLGNNAYMLFTKDVYTYENGRKIRWDHYHNVDGYNAVELSLEWYCTYDYSDDGLTVTQTKISAEEENLVLTVSNYSPYSDLLSRASFSWSEETSSWSNSSLVENEYDGRTLMEKQVTTWDGDTISQQRRESYSYDEEGHCIQILFQTLTAGEYVDTHKADYEYDENGVCTRAAATQWADTAWVLGPFQYQSEYLYFDDCYSQVNNAMGSLYGCTRAEVESYESTPNPYYVEQPVNLDREWYYEILGDDGTVTYQYLQCVGDTTVGGEKPKVLVRTNQIYDKLGQPEITHEYLYEHDNVVYWWNKERQEFTVLYDFNAEVGDEWQITVGNETITVHVDAVAPYHDVTNDQIYRMMQVSDANDVFSGNMVCGVGHLTSFFPERLMSKGYRVEGLRCLWQDGVLVFKYGDRDCDEIYGQCNNDEDESLGAGFVVYPNPTSGVLYIESSNGMEYRITDIWGQTLMFGVIDGNTINMSLLSDGFYILIINNTIKKIIVNQ